MRRNSFIMTTAEFHKTDQRGTIADPKDRGIKGSKQYCVLSAIYRMVRVHGWTVYTAARLLHDRAKFDKSTAKDIASIWFHHGHPKRWTNWTGEAQ